MIGRSTSPNLFTFFRLGDKTFSPAMSDYGGDNDEPHVPPVADALTNMLDLRTASMQTHSMRKKN
jgi:hypothetical protein